MSAKGKPVVVGGFVIGALVLLIVALIVFGGGRFFEERRTFVSYFDGSLKGLRVGSNVLFRGVRVGFVSDIRVEVDRDADEFHVPVTFQILPEAIALVDPEERLLAMDRTPPELAALIDRGLRTRLEMESFVTGQLVIELDFYPDTPINFYGSATGYPEIPSIPSNIQQVLERMQTFVAEIQARVDVDELVEGITSALAGIDALVRSEDLQGALAGLNRLANLEELEAIPVSVLDTMAVLEEALGEIRTLVSATDDRMEPLFAKAEDSLDSLTDTLGDAGNLLDNLAAEVGGDTDLIYQMRRTLEETQAAARSLRHLAEFLERNPEALLRGRRESRE
ncbi:MAG: MlaD family protein [Gammaproteobacteria bacterium]